MAEEHSASLLGLGTEVGAVSPIRPNAIWATDFRFGTTTGGCIDTMLNVIDTLTRGGGPEFLSNLQCRWTFHRSRLAASGRVDRIVSWPAPRRTT